jgi:predicted RNase H-like HicB family nuclease
MESYIALLRKEPDSDYGVSFPDFPGCITAGSTLEEARLMAKEALEAHIAFMAEDGDRIPEPGTLDKLLTPEDARDAIPFLVDVARPDEPAERVNVTFRRSVLGAIDRAAAARGENRSEFLARAGMERAQRSDVVNEREGAYTTNRVLPELRPASAAKKKTKGKTA